MGISMKFSLEVLEALAGYAFVIRATNETGDFASFYIKDLEVVMSRIIQKEEDITNISKDLFKALVASNLLEYDPDDVAFLVC